MPGSRHSGGKTRAPGGRLAALRADMRHLKHGDETAVVEALLQRTETSASLRRRAVDRAVRLVEGSRARKAERGMLDVFLSEFGLSNQEGIALMCLAEALLRVPDTDTADALIAEKITAGQWADHRGRSDSLFVNASTWALMLTGRVVALDRQVTDDPAKWLSRVTNRVGEPIIRNAIGQAMRIMGGEFVLGRTIDEAIKRHARTTAGKGSCSFDMLGEGARTDADARRYCTAYTDAIRQIARQDGNRGIFAGSGISVKLSALHPRYEYAQKEQVFAVLLPRLKALALAAAAADMHFTIDAEEADRLDLSLDLIEALATDPDLDGWQGLGLALQCYTKRAVTIVDWLDALGTVTGRRFMLRLVKGAYWDSEIKWAQEEGLKGYPVFTRKVSTDLSYLVAAERALALPVTIYPQFATHNAHTIVAVLEMAGSNRDFEFQRLHGMGELLYDEARRQTPDLPPVRTYAPVGRHKDLLAYLVRRLLENGANSSFVNRFMDEAVPAAELVRDPVREVKALASIPHTRIPLPRDLFGAERRNAAGMDLSDPETVGGFDAALAARGTETFNAGPLVGGVERAGRGDPVRSPATGDLVGHTLAATRSDIDKALMLATAAQPTWNRLGGAARATILDAAADALEVNRDHFLSLLIREAGKTWGDAVAELREAVDFCRYYGVRARVDFEDPQDMPGPTGELNRLSLNGRGVFLCISPWNFPLAIFMGQVTAALAAGNATIAKPAEQTPLVAMEAVRLLHRAGVPGDILHLLPGDGETVGAALVADTRISGVAMTGSTLTAKIINRALAARDGPIVPLIAETGGQNALFVDSTALPEQVVDDVIRSAFHSAGQRCSALRVLYLQADIADTVIDMLKGAMDALVIGDPASHATDVGPIIDAQARDALLAHIEVMARDARFIHACKAGSDLDHGTFVMPHVFEISGLDVLDREHFGPILHIIRYKAGDLDQELAALRATGFGLTVGVHSRIDGRADYICRHALAGNAYVNRNIIGAVVGVQPFGGCGLSGTGPKAGGPRYLHRFATERVLTVNTVASGGNAMLFCLDED